MKILQIITFGLSFTILFSTSCSFKRHADKVFYNGKIYLMDNNFNSADAFAISNGRIKEVGSNADILSEFAATEKIDLKGAIVFPGFIDAHCHFYGYATDLLKCDLYGTTSFDEVLTKVSEYAKNKKFQWILGRGWDQNDWEEKQFPGKALLDSLYPDKPVFLMRIDGHAALCNSKALEIAGISASTKIDGGEILLKDGKLTGLVIDNAMEKVKEKIPPFSSEMIEESLLKAQDNCFEVGLTTLDDAGLGKDSIQTLIDLQNKSKLKIRIYAMLSDDPATLKHYFKHGPFKNDRMHVNAIKTYADGSLGSRGACFKEEYADQKGHFGFMLHPRKYFEELAEKALNYKFQLCTHVIGDSAAKEIIDVYTNHLSSDNRRRWRLEHCQVMEERDRKKLSDYSIVPSVQPTHATSDMNWAEERLGKKRMKDAYAYEDIRDACDGLIAYGTDFPVENINPMYTLYAAVERKDLQGNPKGGFQIENKTKRKDALRAMTVGAAYANFEEEEKGSIEEGKFADFIILDKDIMKVDEKEIPSIKVLATFINGEKVFERK